MNPDELIEGFEKYYNETWGVDLKTEKLNRNVEPFLKEFLTWINETQIKN